MKMRLVLLAAGESRRFHGNKLLFELDGKPMYRHLTDRLETLPPDLFAEKIVVTRYREIMEQLSGQGYRVIENLHGEWGISHSIHLALECLEGAPGAICFSVCDQPGLRASTVERLVRLWGESGKGIGAVSHGGNPGNPVIFAERYRAELLELKGDTGGKRVLSRHPEDTFLLEIPDAGELEDVDVRPEIVMTERTGHWLC